MNEQHNDLTNDESIELRLWEYIDGLSSSDEKTIIDQLLQSDAVWQAKYGELLEVNELMYSAELEHPSLRFTKNVMEDIARLQIAPATRSYINKKIIWGIAAFFITMVIGFLIYGFGQVDWSATSDSKLPEAITKIDYTRFFSNTYVNVFMMINIILGLFLLDRFLANKRKKYQHQS